MKYMKSSQAENHSQNLENNKKVDWNDFNYPCLIHLFHYDANQTPGVLKWRARFLRINHLLIIFTTLWNFVNNIVDTAQGVDQGGLRIAISVFSALLWFPVSLYMFMIPYRIYMKEEDKTCLYYVLSITATIFFFIWSIANFADANGWVMLAQLINAGYKGAAFFSFFTALFSLTISLLSAINMGLFYRREARDD